MKKISPDITGYDSQDEEALLLEKQKELMAKFMPMVQQTVNLAAQLTPVAPKCKVEDCMRDAVNMGRCEDHKESIADMYRESLTGKRYSQILQEPDEPAEQPQKALTWSINIPDVVVFGVGLALSLSIAVGVVIGDMSLSALCWFAYAAGIGFLWPELGLSRDWKWKRRPKAAKKPVLSSKEPLSPPSV